METREVRWCTTHESLACRPDDDPDNYWMCETSNLTGCKNVCEIVVAEVSWLSP